MTYTTRANIESYLRAKFDDFSTPTCAEVDTWVTEVDAEIDNIVGTTYTSTTNTEIIDLNVATNRFIVEKYPLISVTSAEYNDYTLTDPAFNPNWVAFDNNRVLGDIVITDKTIYPRQGAEVKLVYQYGHASVPSEVSFLATLMVVKKITGSDDIANSGTESLSIGSLSLTSNIGVTRLLNIDNTIKEQLSRIGRHKTIFRGK